MSPVRTKYPNLREYVHSDFAERSDKSREAALEKIGVEAEAAEGFFDDLGKFAQKVAPAVLPVAGTVRGGAVGGPIGASLRSGVGSCAGKAVGGARGQARSAGAASSLR